MGMGHTQEGVWICGHTQDIGVEVWGHTQDIRVEVWGHTQDIGGMDGVTHRT